MLFINVYFFYLKALGGRPANETFPYNCRFGSRGVIGRRVDINRAPATKKDEKNNWTMFIINLKTL